MIPTLLDEATILHCIEIIGSERFCQITGVNKIHLGRIAAVAISCEASKNLTDAVAKANPNPKTRPSN